MGGTWSSRGCFGGNAGQQRARRAQALTGAAYGFVERHCTAAPGVFTPGNACATAFMVYWWANSTQKRRGAVGCADPVSDGGVAYAVCSAAQDLGAKHAVYPVVGGGCALRMVVGLRVDSVPA